MSVILKSWIQILSKQNYCFSSFDIVNLSALLYVLSLIPNVFHSLLQSSLQRALAAQEPLFFNFN